MMMKLNKLSSLEFHNMKISCSMKNSKISIWKMNLIRETRFQIFLQTITRVNFKETNLRNISQTMEIAVIFKRQMFRTISVTLECIIKVQDNRYFLNCNKLKNMMKKWVLFKKIAFKALHWQSVNQRATAKRMRLVILIKLRQ